jgi:hypothetical protein
MHYLPVDNPPAIVIVADNRDYANPDNRPSLTPNVDRYLQIEQQRTQQRLNELAPKAATDPDAARRYRELSDWNARQLQILTDPSR